MARRRGSLALGAILMAGIGYAAGILTAPKSGKETRKDIQRSARKAKLEAERKLKAAHGELADLITQGRSTAKNLTDKAKTEVNKALKAAQAAKDRVRDALSAAHEGESDDEDLQAAIDEANKAISHLKQYVKKGKHASKAKKTRS